MSALVLALFAGPAIAVGPPPTPSVEPSPAPSPTPLKDASGRTLRRAPTGHVTNYDEPKIPAYELPDPLVLRNGKPVTDADTWLKLRRPEILKLYETEIYGRVPARAPKVRFQVVEKGASALDGAALRKDIVGQFGDRPDAPQMNIALYLPAKAVGRVPVVLHLSLAPGATGTGPRRDAYIADILARGYAYALVTYTEIQLDNAAGRSTGVMGLTLAPGQTAAAPDEWGTIAAWAWGLSRVQDYLETDTAVDAKRVAIVGHSRLGKAVLWAAAQDRRFALVFSSQGGEMGSALARRDFGETVDDMAANFGYQFAGNFQKYAGHWNDMPVDAHFLIALCAPRPLLITGASGDLWSDPRGEFLGAVAAGAVYRLLGATDLGTTTMPALDTPVMTGTLAYMEHDGPHAITPLDWKTFLDFADKHLKPLAN